MQRGFMKKLAALVLVVGLGLGASLPGYAATQNKYKGIDSQSRKAQKKEAKQIRKYAARQRKAERKLNKAARKNKPYKPTQK